jgi:hypothetical protein
MATCRKDALEKTRQILPQRVPLIGHLRREGGAMEVKGETIAHYDEHMYVPALSDSIQAAI